MPSSDVLVDILGCPGAYSEGEAYAEGDKVAQSGFVLECKPHAYNLFCPMAESAPDVDSPDGEVIPLWKTAWSIKTVCKDTVDKAAPSKMTARKDNLNTKLTKTLRKWTGNSHHEVATITIAAMSVFGGTAAIADEELKKLRTKKEAVEAHHDDFDAETKGQGWFADLGPKELSAKSKVEFDAKVVTKGHFKSGDELQVAAKAKENFVELKELSDKSSEKLSVKSSEDFYAEARSKDYFTDKSGKELNTRAGELVANDFLDELYAKNNEELDTPGVATNLPDVSVGGSAPPATGDPLVAPVPCKNKVNFDWLASWYHVLPVDDLGREKPIPLELLGVKLIAPRAPLSEGRVEEDGSILCSCHGWRYNGKGDPTAVPRAGSTSELQRMIDNRKPSCNAFPTKVKATLFYVWPASGSDA